MACSYCLPCHRLHNHSACCTHWLIHLLILIYSNLFTFVFVAHLLLLNSKLIFSCHFEFSLTFFFWVSQCKTILKNEMEIGVIFLREMSLFWGKTWQTKITVIQTGTGKGTGRVKTEHLRKKADSLVLEAHYQFHLKYPLVKKDKSQFTHTLSEFTCAFLSVHALTYFILSYNGSKTHWLSPTIFF